MSRPLQVSRAPGGQPAAQFVGSCSLPVQRALWHPQLHALSKKVITQGKALHPFLGTWEGTMIMVVHLKARETHSEKQTDGIIKTTYIYIYT